MVTSVPNKHVGYGRTLASLSPHDMSPWIALTAACIDNQNINFQKVGCTLKEDGVAPHFVLHQILPVVCPGGDTIQALEVFPEIHNIYNIYITAIIINFY